MGRGFKLIEYECIGSTNAEAKAYAASADSRGPVLFVARAQSAGRGRLGRSFLSRGGRGIYMSLLYFTHEPLCDAVSVTSSAAVIVSKAIESTVGEPMRIKWVNDIYNSDGKVAGILAETLPLGEYNAVIVGIGINTGECDFPEELRDIASSIGAISEEQRQGMIEQIADGLLCFADAPLLCEYMADYRARSMLDGAEIDLLRAGEIVAHGRVLGIDDDGGLMFLRDGECKPEIIRTGEVSVRNIKG